MPFSSSTPGASFCKRSTSPKISFSDAPVTAVVTSAVSTQYPSCTRREIWLFGEYVYPFCSRMLDVIREPNDPPSNVFVTASGILSGLSALGTGKPTKIVDCAASGRSDRKSTRLNSSHGYISYAVFCLKKKKDKQGQSNFVDTATVARHRG